MKPDGGLTFLVIEGGPKFDEGPQTQFWGRGSSLFHPKGAASFSIQNFLKKKLSSFEINSHLRHDSIL